MIFNPEVNFLYGLLTKNVYRDKIINEIRLDLLWGPRRQVHDDLEK